MGSITLLKGTAIAGTGYLAGASVSVSFALAKQLVGENSAKFTNAAVSAPLPNTPGATGFLAATALTGDYPSGLNGYLAGEVPVGRLFECVLTGENRPRRYLLITKSGETPDADTVIEPPDFDATDNNKLLLLVQ